MCRRDRWRHPARIHENDRSSTNDRAVHKNALVIDGNRSGTISPHEIHDAAEVTVMDDEVVRIIGERRRTRTITQCYDDTRTCCLRKPRFPSQLSQLLRQNAHLVARGSALALELCQLSPKIDNLLSGSIILIFESLHDFDQLDILDRNDVGFVHCGLKLDSQKVSESDNHDKQRSEENAPAYSTCGHGGPGITAWPSNRRSMVTFFPLNAGIPRTAIPRSIFEAPFALSPKISVLPSFNRTASPIDEDSDMPMIAS